MRYLNWILGTVLFIALLGFAVKNDQPVALRYFFGYEWHSSLVNILLVFFTVGTVIGVIAMFATILKQRREIARLKHELQLRQKLSRVSTES